MECPDGAPWMPGVWFWDILGTRARTPYILSIIGIGKSVMLLEIGYDFYIGDSVVLLAWREKHRFIYIWIWIWILLFMILLP
jgi:hypothetical protein